jgi:hypothetical protein
MSELMRELENLNRAAWEQHKPFIQFASGMIMRVVDPEILRDELILFGLNTAYLDAATTAVPRWTNG